MTNLNHIFPSDYLNPPTEEDLQFEVQDLLCCTDYPPQLLTKIDAMQCPYYKEALMQCLKQEWHQMVERRDERTGYYDTENNWIICWLDAELEMKRYIKRYRNEQDSFVYTATDLQPIHQRSITQHVKDSVKQVVNDLMAIKEVAQSKNIHITIHAPIYVMTVNGDNLGTMAGQHTTNNH